MSPFDLAAILLVSPLLVTTLVIVAETMAGLYPGGHAEVPAPLSDPSSVAVLVPAHDEEKGIGAMLVAQRAAMPAGMRLLVIADNCTDATAAIARAAGAEVGERHDPVRRGKGFALSFGRAMLASGRPPACVIVLDADTIAPGDSLARLAALAIAARRPVQGAYVIEPAAADGPIARFSAAAFFVKNVIRQLGAKRLGGPALLTGSGMAFPWPVFAGLPLDTGHVAEDLMLGVHCCLAGHAPLFDLDARIVGTSSSDRGTATQRRRWESGFLQVASENIPALLRTAVRDRRPALSWLALDLATPPLVLLLTLDLVAATLLLGLSLAGIGTAAPWLAMAAAMLAAGIGVIAGLAAHRRLDLLRGWPAIPLYLIWKLGLSLATIRRRERNWIRTERD